MKSNKYYKSPELKELQKEINDFRVKRDPNAKKIYYSDKSAPEIEKAVIHYTFLRGWFAEKVSSMGRNILKNGSLIFVPNNNTTGQADLSVIIAGRSIKVEVKCLYTMDKWQSTAQKRYQRQIEKANGIYIIIRTFKEYKDWFDNYLLNLQNEKTRR